MRLIRSRRRSCGVSVGILRNSFCFGITKPGGQILSLAGAEFDASINAVQRQGQSALGRLDWMACEESLDIVPIGTVAERAGRCDHTGSAAHRKSCLHLRPVLLDPGPGRFASSRTVKEGDQKKRRVLTSHLRGYSHFKRSLHQFRLGESNQSKQEVQKLFW